MQQLSAPFVVGSDTSKEAAESIQNDLGRLERAVFDVIRLSGLNGRTDDESEVQLGMRHQTASARRRGLVLKGLVLDSGRRRKTRSGRPAVVWVAKEHLPLLEGTESTGTEESRPKPLKAPRGV